MDIEMSQLEALERQLLGAARNWRDKWDAASTHTEPLRREGFVLRAHLCRSQPSTPTLTLLGDLERRLAAEPAPEAAAPLERSIAVMEDAGAAFDAWCETPIRVENLVDELLDGVAAALDASPILWPATMKVVDVVCEQRHLLADAAPRARAWRSLYRPDIELPLRLLIAAILEGAREVSAPEPCVGVDPPFTPISEPPSQEDATADSLHAFIEGTVNSIRMAASSPETANQDAKRLLRLWISWHLIAGRPEACQQLIDVFSDEISADECAVLRRRAQSTVATPAPDSCWLLFSLPDSAERLWPAVACPVAVRSDKHASALTRLGGLSADGDFREAALRALHLADADLDGAAWDVVGLERVPQPLRTHALVGASAGLALYAHACWARRGLAPSVPIAITGELDAAGTVRTVRDLKPKHRAAMRAQITWVFAPQGDEPHIDRQRRLIHLPEGHKAARSLEIIERILTEIGAPLAPDPHRWEAWLAHADDLLERRDLAAYEVFAGKLAQLTAGQVDAKSGEWWILTRFRVTLHRAASCLHCGDALEGRRWFEHAMNIGRTRSFRPRVVTTRWLLGSLIQAAIDLGAPELPASVPEAGVSLALAIDDESLDDEARYHAAGSWAEWLCYQGAIAQTSPVRDRHFSEAERILKHKAQIERISAHQQPTAGPVLLRAHGQLAQLYTLWGRYDDAGSVLEPVRELGPQELDRFAGTGVGQPQSAANWRFQAAYAVRLASLRAVASGALPDDRELNWIEQAVDRLRRVCAEGECHLLALVERSVLLLRLCGSTRPELRLEDAWLVVRHAADEYPQHQVIAWGLAASAIACLRVKVKPEDQIQPWRQRTEGLVSRAQAWFGRTDEMRQMTDSDPADDLHTHVRRIMRITLY